MGRNLGIIRKDNEEPGRSDLITIIIRIIMADIISKQMI